MKILAVGDTHGDEGIIKKAAKQAKKEKVDLVILAGDLTFFEQQTKNLIKPFEEIGKEVLILPGNHETMPTIKFIEDKYSKAINLHGKHFEKDGVGFFGAGYATNVGPFWIEEKEIFSLLEKSHNKIKHLSKKVLITHMHPEGSYSEFSGFKGSSSIKKIIEKFQPDLAIFSHIHEARGTENKLGKTILLNVSRKPKIFEI
jgi:Icc-related predicted phosphoesterase